jgi:DNA-binding GntR family transcriptional regulator
LPKSDYSSNRSEVRSATVVRLPVHSELVSALRDLIIEGELPADGRLSERMLCEKLGVSRSPLREAIKALSAEGLVEIVPNCGARVRKFSIEQIEEMVEVVTLLELAAAGYACERATDADIARIGELHYRMLGHYAAADWLNYAKVNVDVHQAIVDSAGNDALSDMYRQLNAKLRPYRYQFHYLPAPEDGQQKWEWVIQSALSDHERLFEALRARDVSRMTEIIAGHYKPRMDIFKAWQLSKESAQERI